MVILGYDTLTNTLRQTLRHDFSQTTSLSDASLYTMQQAH